MADHRRLCLASTLRNVTVQHFTDIHKLHQSRDICLYPNFDSLHRRDVDAVGLDLLINLKKRSPHFMQSEEKLASRVGSWRRRRRQNTSQFGRARLEASSVTGFLFPFYPFSWTWSRVVTQRISKDIHFLALKWCWWSVYWRSNRLSEGVAVRQGFYARRARRVCLPGACRWGKQQAQKYGPGWAWAASCLTNGVVCMRIRRNGEVQDTLVEK